MGLPRGEDISEDGVLLDDALTAPAAGADRRAASSIVVAGPRRDVVLRPRTPSSIRSCVFLPNTLLDLVTQGVVAAGRSRRPGSVSVLAEEILAADGAAAQRSQNFASMAQKRTYLPSAGSRNAGTWPTRPGPFFRPAPRSTSRGVQHRDGVEPLVAEHRVGARHVEVAPFAGPAAHVSNAVR